MSDITYAYPLILNKVASPHYATPVLRRARLLDWLNDAANCRAAVIAADAGYGKTTLLWQWEREADFPCYWYKLDRTDRDWTFHISYLIEAISKRHKGFGRRAHSMLQQMGGPNTSRPGVTAYLLAEMHDRLTEPCTFIIDDWQYVNAVTEVRGLWNQILRDAPPTCRFVFASRVKPKLQFARFKTHAGYAELRTDALRFTEAEIAELFRDIYNDPLSHADVVELERRTEGWAVSLQLVEVWLRERGNSEDRLDFIRSITATRDSDLFDFLAEEVLDQQPAVTRNFLLSTSILHQITPEVAERLTGAHDGTRALADLEHRGLFTSRLDDVRYRYHGLFREFLERRLRMERGDAEVAGLHIHAASYFETSEQWPEAIHHYLGAGLHRQAARLIARSGEDLVSEGRLGLVDEWIPQVPLEVIRANARLSLLYGEAHGMRGDWDRAVEALERARGYFSKKGDRRFDALACLKLSSVYSNYGDPSKAAEFAQAGLEIAPADAIATRLRLQGNLAITRVWLTEPLEAVLAECRRIAEESARMGLEHFSAIANHNAGEVLARLGRYPEAVQCLRSASRFWSDPPTHPFADNADLVFSLLSVGDISEARQSAADGLKRTEPWSRPHAIALVGQAAVHVADSRLLDAIACLEAAKADPAVVGVGPISVIDAALAEALFLSGAEPARIADVAGRLAGRPEDPRDASETATARALAIHAVPACSGECITAAAGLLDEAKFSAPGKAVMGEVKIGALRLSHRRRRDVLKAWTAVGNALDAGLGVRLRPWTRLYANHASTAMTLSHGASLLSRLLDGDPEGWRQAVVEALPRAVGADRDLLLQAISRHANRKTIAALRNIQGTDIADVRRQMQQAAAPRLYLRTFGGVSLHRGDWTGPVLHIEKKRVRLLLAALAARPNTALTRDMAIETMWPDAEPNAAINSLNQTVFQLRRYIDPTYRGGESPDYVISSSEQIALNHSLVRTDLEEIRRLPEKVHGADWEQRNALAARAIALVRGEFLSDLPYEDWTAVQQITVHGEVRARLLPIAMQASGYELGVSLQAASALVTLDPFDEKAVLALADCLTRSGRRVAARDLIVDYATRLHAELDESPSQALTTAAQAVGGLDRIKRQLTGAGS